MNILEYQNDVLTILNNSFAKNHLSHAYIFEGEKGSGLKEVAIFLAQKLLCLDNHSACGVCENCKRVSNGTHTNVILIEPIQNNIRKDQINSLIKEGHMTSLTDKSRIFIINGAEKMNRAAANSLLKFLEEPTPNNYLILLTENSNMLLETITSRAQLIRFKPINKEQLANTLHDEGIEKDVSYILSELFGSYEAAKESLKEGTIINSYDMFKKIINAMISKKDIYIEYYLNKKLLNSLNAHVWFLEILTLFKREQIRYIEKRTCRHFKELLDNLEFDSTIVNQITEQIEKINHAIEEINLKINSDLIYAGLFQSL
ncbi:MAG: hypothetical protein IKC22_00185 [Bacilli bacterium]|nr:hypothetical protein [Bacilli bacterium]